MRYRERVWTPSAPASLAVSVEEFKAHARITFAESDDQIEDIFLPAAISYVEKETQRLLTAREAVLRLPTLPDGFCDVELPGGEVSAVESVVADGVTIDGSAYEVVGDSPARILALEAWPAVTGRGLPVTITYTAGFAEAPAELKVAVCMIAAENYRRRTEADIEGAQRVPLGAAHYIGKWRIRAL